MSFAQKVIKILDKILWVSLDVLLLHLSSQQTSSYILSYIYGFNYIGRLGRLHLISISE